MTIPSGRHDPPLVPGFITGHQHAGASSGISPEGSMGTVNHLSRTASSEERRENGLGLIMIGFMLWFFDTLVFFFMPAGTRLGHPRPFQVLMASAFVAGSILMAIGTRLRKQ
jgi:hypothetical protein